MSQTEETTDVTKPQFITRDLLWWWAVAATSVITFIMWKAALPAVPIVGNMIARWARNTWRPIAAQIEFIGSAWGILAVIAVIAAILVLLGGKGR